MADDLQNKLQDASKAYQAGKLAEAKKVLSNAPEDDPKVRHNLAMVDYLHSGGNHNDVVANLSLGPVIGAKDASSWTKHDAFCYEGNEIAAYNKAAILLHCGMAEQAAHIFEFLATKPALLAPALQLRVAFLLQVATMPTGKAKHRTKTQEDLINAIITDKANVDQIAKDETLKSMMEVAFSDGSTLHEWYKDHNKTHAETAVYFNNLGVNAMNDGKPNVASLYFARAAKEVTDLGSDLAFTHSIMYNSGLCSLALGNNQAALECFKHCVQTMKGSAMLWVRVAQASVGMFSATVEEEGAKTAAEVHKAVSDSVLGSGKVAAGAMYFSHLPEAEQLYPRELNAQQNELLNTAYKAIVSALGLLPTPNDVITKVITTTSQPGQILQYAHVFGAFIALSLADYGAAHTHCQQLLGMHSAKDSPLNPDVHTAALSYAAEALCHMNHPDLALKTLQSSNLSDLVVGSDRASAQQKSAVEGLFVNLCIVHILNGSWKQAQNLTTNIVSKFSKSTGIAAQAAALLEVYLEIALGNHEKALELLGSRPAAYA